MLRHYLAFALLVTAQSLHHERREHNSALQPVSVVLSNERKIQMLISSHCISFHLITSHFISLPTLKTHPLLYSCTAQQASLLSRGDNTPNLPSAAEPMIPMPGSLGDQLLDKMKVGNSRKFDNET